MPGDRLAALIRVADLLVREHGIGVEAAGEVTPELLAAAGVTVSNVRAWVAPLLEDQDRADESVERPQPVDRREPDAPRLRRDARPAGVGRPSVDGPSELRLR